MKLTEQGVEKLFKHYFNLIKKISYALIWSKENF